MSYGEPPDRLSYEGWHRTLLHRWLEGEKPRVGERPVGALVALLQRSIDRRILLARAHKLCLRDGNVARSEGRSEGCADS